MVAASGDRLLAPAAIKVLRRVLIPRALVITPNLPEAAALLDGPVARNEAEMREQAQRLLKLGCARGAAQRRPRRRPGKRRPAGGADHGGAARGRALSRPRTRTAPAARCRRRSRAGLAKGQDLATAVRKAKDYVTAAITASDRIKIGSGHGPTHHFHAWW